MGDIIIIVLLLVCIFAELLLFFAVCVEEPLVLESLLNIDAFGRVWVDALFKEIQETETAVADVWVGVLLVFYLLACLLEHCWLKVKAK